MHATTVEIVSRESARQFRSAVSLHSHTWHSKEALGFLPEWMARAPLLRSLFSRELRQYRVDHGSDLDFERAFWRPPLMPSAVHWSESAQIGEGLGLHPIVSLTDHDSIDAPLSLLTTMPSSDVPVSIEWSVPVGTSIFHVGVHNLPPGEAPGIVRSMSEYTESPAPARLDELLSFLDGMPGVLTVLNHPMWNGDVNGMQGADALDALLRRVSPWIHALELNGYRRWPENEAVMQLARRWDLPVVAGGDRHGRTPNALLNLSHARTFAGFADEVRTRRRTHVAVMPGYLDHSLREIDAVSDVLASDPDLLPEFRHWSQRIFITLEDGGVRRLVEAWGGRAPIWIHGFIGLIRLMGAAPVRPVVRLALNGAAARLF